MGEGRGDVWLAGMLLDFLLLTCIVLGVEERGEGGEGGKGLCSFFAVGGQAGGGGSTSDVGESRLAALDAEDTMGGDGYADAAVA